MGLERSKRGAAHRAEIGARRQSERREQAVGRQGLDRKGFPQRRVQATGKRRILPSDQIGELQRTLLHREHGPRIVVQPVQRRLERRRRFVESRLPHAQLREHHVGLGRLICPEPLDQRERGVGAGLRFHVGGEHEL